MYYETASGIFILYGCVTMGLMQFFISILSGDAMKRIHALHRILRR